MTERKFTNNYDIVVCAISTLRRQYQKDDNIFAKQFIWWLASIIQYTEILKFYLQDHTFPSDYVRDCKDTRLLLGVPSNVPLAVVMIHAWNGCRYMQMQLRYHEYKTPTTQRTSSSLSAK